MSPSPAAVATIVGAALAFAVFAGEQVDGGKAPTPPSSITLDQLPGNDKPSAGADRSADVDIAQPAHPSHSVAVTSSEISDRSAGRALTVSPIAGSDRCEAETHDRSALCRKRLEARAGQYARPQPVPVTPEARLLLLSRPRDMAVGDRIGERQFDGAAVLNAPNGPAEQLAGALRDRTAGQDAAATAPAKTPDNGPLPPSVPPIVILPTR